MRRVGLILAAIVVIVYAIQGGEYGTTDLLRFRTRRQALDASIDSLTRAIDSLAAYRRAVASDPAVQERIAREEFGMVRGDREILYRFADSVPGIRPSPSTDSAGASRR